MQHPACRGACGCMDPERWLRALVVTEPRSLRAFEAVAGSLDNTIMVVVPGAMEAGLSNILFWGSLAFSLVVAGLFAFPVNRRLIARGKGHTAVHETGIHGGPPTRVVAIAAAVAFVFGTWVLAAEAFARW